MFIEDHAILLMRRNVWFANVKSAITEGSGRLHRGWKVALTNVRCDLGSIVSCTYTCVFCKCEIWYLIYQGRRAADVTNVRLERVLYLTIQIWFWSCSMFVCYSHKYVIRKCEIWDQGRKRAVCRESWCDESEIRCPPSVSYALPLFLTVSTLQQIFSSIFLSVQTFI